MFGTNPRRLSMPPGRIVHDPGEIPTPGDDIGVIDGFPGPPEGVVPALKARASGDWSRLTGHGPRGTFRRSFVHEEDLDSLQSPRHRQDGTVATDVRIPFTSCGASRRLHYTRKA